MVETVKIDASVLGIKKAIEVPTTYRNVRAAFVFNRDLINSEIEAEGGDDEDFDPTKFLVANIKRLDQMADYIKTTLGLTEKQADKIQDLAVTDMVGLGQTIASEVLHMTPTEEAPDQKSDDEDGATV